MTSQAGGRYEMRDVLGEGGHATVYRAFDRVRGHDVALKILLPHVSGDADLRERFAAEAMALASLQHGNIVRVFEIDAHSRWPSFSMELIEGVTLNDLLATGRGLPPHEVFGLLGSLASAVDYLHAAGLVHRDIKPANVMVDTHGRVVLMDLGIARSLDSGGRTMAGTAVGTPEYMAPEQVRGKPAGPPADIYALGILAYQLLAGQPPFEGDTAFVLHAQAYTKPPPLRERCPGLPAFVYAAVDAALDKAPERRPESAEVFVQLLAGGRPGTPDPYWHAVQEVQRLTPQRARPAVRSASHKRVDPPWREQAWPEQPPAAIASGVGPPTPVRPFAGVPPLVLLVLAALVLVIVLSLFLGLLAATLSISTPPLAVLRPVAVRPLLAEPQPGPLVALPAARPVAAFA